MHAADSPRRICECVEESRTLYYEHTRGSKTDVQERLPAALGTLQQILTAGESGNAALSDNAGGAISRIAIARGMRQGA